MESTKNIGIYIDFRYFSTLYTEFLHKGKELNVKAFFDPFVRHEISERIKSPMSQCEIRNVNFYIGGTAEQEEEKMLEKALVDASLGDNIHRLSLSPGSKREKGVDILLALEAYEAAKEQRYDIMVLISGNADFVPLIKKVNDLNKTVMLVFWDLESSKTRTAQSLIDSVQPTFAIPFLDICRSRIKTNHHIDLLFKQAGKVDLPEDSKNNEASISQDFHILLQEALLKCNADADGWILLAELGTFLKVSKGFDPLASTGKKLADLIKEYSDMVELKAIGNPPHYKVRLHSHIKGLSKIIPRTLARQHSSSEYKTSTVLKADLVNDFGFIQSPKMFSDRERNNYRFRPSLVENSFGKNICEGTSVKYRLDIDKFRSEKHGVDIYKAIDVQVLN